MSEQLQDKKEKFKINFKKIRKNILIHRNRYIFLASLLLLTGISIFVYFTIFWKLPSPVNLKDYKVIPLSTHIYDRNGKLLYVVYKDQNRTPIKLKDLPDYVGHATIAIEDKDFYHHGGVSLISGVFRAFRDMIASKNLQGGSTLTQQLVKKSLLTEERTITRKVKEIILAVWTEHLFSKNEILEMYLNTVPYGGSAYGIEQASETFFGKHAKDITLEQAALLAGLPQLPSRYSPYINPSLALQRRNDVLDRMYVQKYITQAQLQKAKKTPINVIPLKTDIKAPHFVFFVKEQLEKDYGVEAVEQGGLQVTTTLDLDLQQNAEKILNDELDKIKYLNVSNGAVLSMRPPTGEVLLMVGSRDYFATPSGAFNSTTAMRQPGSAIKPINYAIGIERHLVTPASVFLDDRTCFSTASQKPYCPVNYDGKFHGPTQLRFALGNSLNIPAVKMLAMNGVDTFIASASAFTIDSFKDPSRYGLSLTLGGGEVPMYELAQAFTAFANRGVPKRVQSILKVKDKKGKILYKFQDTNFVIDVKKSIPEPNFLAISGKQAISEETAYLISHILLDNNARSQAFGGSSALIVPKHAVSVKTGTTDDKRDNWTVGYTPNFLTAVWVGNNDNSPMNPYLASGITGAAPIWNKVMVTLLKNQPDLWPRKPENVIGVQVCTDTGAIMNKNPDGTSNCPSRFEYIIKGTTGIPLKTERKTIPVSKDTGKMAKEGDPNIEMQEKTVISDGYTTYCVDCAHDVDPTPAPQP